MGQIDPHVRYLSRGPRYSLFLKSTEAVLSIPARKTAGGKPQPAALRMQVVGADPAAPTEGLDPAQTRINYFTGSDPSRWRTGVETFGSVHYQDIYPGIDLIFHGRQGQLEYDFVVKRGADPARIAVAFEGASKLNIGENGDLIVDTDAGEVRWKKPVTYQDTASGRKEVASQFTIASNGQVQFRVASYDAELPLVIDPQLVYSTLLGGTNTENLRALAVDGSGNAYVAGWSFSTHFPATNGQQGANGDVYVAKLNPAGTALLYATFIGGNYSDSAYALAIDATGNAYVAGDTNSANFPTLNAFSSTIGSIDSYDAFVLKLNPSGALLFSTYLGGVGFDTARGIGVDSSLNLYVAGETNSSNFPMQAPVQPSLVAGSSDAFVTKLSTAGNTLVYSTYLGGTGFDRILGPKGLAIDSAGNAYVPAGRILRTSHGQCRSTIQCRRNGRLCSQT